MRSLDVGSTGSLTVLAIGAHADDIEIGAGGTLLRMQEQVADLRVHVVVLTSDDTRSAEAEASARGFLPDAEVHVQAHRFTDGLLPAQWSAVKAVIHELAGSVPADIILAPAPSDAHQDHRTVAEIIPTEFRDHLTLHYEIPKWDGDLGRFPASHYVPLQERHIQRKCQLLARHFESQAGHDWFMDETFRGLARLRGMECRAPYAEAFSVHKAVINFGGANLGSAGKGNS